MKRNEPVDVPVFLFLGFLDGGKTRFIQETLEDSRFNAGERTLLLVCEEGEEEDGHCVAHQKYFPSDELRIFMVAVPVAYFQAITFLAGTSGHVSASLHRPEPLSSPPILSWRLNC